MKLKRALTSFLFAVVCPLFANAAVIPGKVASVTIGLTATHTDAGFLNGEYEKETPTSTGFRYDYKTIITKKKVSNKEFVEELLIKYSLGPSIFSVTEWKNWKLEYVSSFDGEGYFLTHKTGFPIQFLGGPMLSSSDSAIDINYVGREAAARSIIHLEDNKGYTQTGSDTASQTVYFNLNVSDVSLNLVGLFNFSDTYSLKYTAIDDLETGAYKVSAQSITGIIGDDNFGDTEEGGVIVTGSISISAAKDVADVTAYMNALNTD